MAESFLRVSTCQQFDINNPVTDQGSKAKLGASFWRPVPASGWFYLGFYATPNYNNPPSPSGPLMVVQPSVDPRGGEIAALAPPTALVPIWTCVGDRQKSNLGIYGLVAPPGYIGLGSIAVPDFHYPPQVNAYPGLMCVRQDLCKLVTVGTSNVIWTDKDSGAPTDVTVWLLPGAQTCYAVANQSGGYPDSYQVWDLRNASNLSQR